MQGFTEKIVGLMKSENLFESQGGPIILSQVWFPGRCLLWFHSFLWYLYGVYNYRYDAFSDMLFQIENEYGAQSKLLGSTGYNYITWAAKMAVEMGTGVPWVMCKEDDAPDPVVSSLTLKHLKHKFNSNCILFNMLTYSY